MADWDKGTEIWVNPKTPVEGDRVKHVKDGRTGIVADYYNCLQVRVHWLDEAGNVISKSTLGTDKLEKI